MSDDSFDPNQVPKDLVEALCLLKTIRPDLDFLTPGRIGNLRERIDTLLAKYPRIGKVSR